MGIAVNARSGESPQVLSTRAAPCSARPGDWDLDAGTPDNWNRAIATCRACPLLAQCSELAVTLAAKNQGPRAMIWAGVAYDDGGRPIGDLDILYRRRSRQPVHRPGQTLIIRTAGKTHSTVPRPAPGKSIVIYRGRRSRTDR